MMLEDDRVLREGHVTLKYFLIEDTAFAARNEAWSLAEDQIGADLTERSIVAEPVRHVGDDYQVYEVVIMAQIDTDD